MKFKVFRVETNLKGLGSLVGPTTLSADYQFAPACQAARKEEGSRFLRWRSLARSPGSDLVTSVGLCQSVAVSELSKKFSTLAALSYVMPCWSSKKETAATGLGSLYVHRSSYQLNAQKLASRSHLQSPLHQNDTLH